MPVCPDCNLGIPDTFAKCPDCGGTLQVLEEPGIELDLELLAQLSIETDDALSDEGDDFEIEVVAATEVTIEATDEPEPEPEPEREAEPEREPEAEREPEPAPERVPEPEPEVVEVVAQAEREPDPEPEPEPERERKPAPAPEPEREPEPRAELEPVAEVRPLATARPRKPHLKLAPPPPGRRDPKQKPKHKPTQKKTPKPKTVVADEPAREAEPEPVLQAVPEPEPIENILGTFLGTLKEVAGLGPHAENVLVFEAAFMLPTDETIDLEEIESAELRKTNLDLYRELCLHVKGGAQRTMRWLPEYNEDLTSIPLLRTALGDRLRSFEPSKR